MRRGTEADVPQSWWGGGGLQITVSTNLPAMRVNHYESRSSSFSEATPGYASWNREELSLPSTGKVSGLQTIYHYFKLLCFVVVFYIAKVTDTKFNC